MKRINVFMCMLLLLTITIGCSSEENHQQEEQNYLRLFAISGCKSTNESNSQVNTNRSTVFDTTELVRYEGTNDGCLMIFHENSIFSCETEVKAKVTINDNIITIIEEEVAPIANCLCCYDLSMKVGPLENKLYKVFISKGNEQEPYINFTIDYSSNIKGEIKFERKY